MNKPNIFAHIRIYILMKERENKKINKLINYMLEGGLQTQIRVKGSRVWRAPISNEVA